MKKSFHIGATGAAILMAVGMTSVAQAADNADATATVEVLKPILVENTAPMDFAAVAVNGAGSMTLAINAGAADLACTANLVCLGTPSLAAFRVYSGSVSRKVTVTLPTAGIDLVSASAIDPAAPTAAEKIELSAYSTDMALDANSEYFVDLGGNGVGIDGEATFLMGGQLDLDGSEGAGTYSGTFNVSVEYS